jgi:ferredoxin
MAKVATVSKDGCIGCGACTGICPNVFVIEDDGKAGVAVSEVAAEDESAVDEAAAACPVAAIEVQ